jgi:hypothetical protein
LPITRRLSVSLLTLAIALGTLALPVTSVWAATTAPTAQPRIGAAAVVMSSEGGYNGFPDGIVLPDGTIRVWYTHGTQHGGTATSVLRSSSDGGKTWSASQATGSVRGIVRLSDGTIVAGTMINVGGTSLDARRPASMRSTNGGLSWTTDGLAAGGAGFTAESGPLSMVRLPDNTLLMAVHGRDKSGTVYSPWYVRYLGSSDGGRTWAVRSSIRSSTKSYDEPGLAVGTNGHLLTTLRADDATGLDGSILLTESTDGGRTWSALRNLQPHASGFPRAATLPDGSIVVMYRATWTAFSPFRYARSVDNGATWSFGLDFTGGSVQKMMGGAWLTGPNRTAVGVAYGLEADWYHSTVLYRTLTLPTTGTEIRGMGRTIIHDAYGTSVRVTGRLVSVAADGTERRKPGVPVHFSLRSYDPADKATVFDRRRDTVTDANGLIDAVVPIPRHGEVAMFADGMTGITYWIGTYRSSPGFATCPTARTAASGVTMSLTCQARPVAGFGGEFQRLTSTGWVHEKSAWANASGVFSTPIRITVTTKYRLTIWQTKWTDRVYSLTITVTVN